MGRQFKFGAFMLMFYLLFSHLNLDAQDNYKYEIGGMLGSSFYMGDANKTKLFQDSKLVGGAVFRYNKDLNWAVKTNLLVGQVGGDTRKSGNVFPYEKQISFNRTFIDVGAQVEYNFFSYSDQFEYLGTKKLSPYAFIGLGATYGFGDKNFIGVNLPVGLGLKYKLRERLNVGFEFSFRKLFGDSFDVTSNNVNKLSLEDPYNIKSSFMKNKDWYALTMIFITWDFGLRVCPCLNID